MSSDDQPNASPPDRREAVRNKAQLVQAKQARMRAIRIGSVVFGATAILAVTAVVVTWAISSSVSAPRLQPANASQDGFEVSDVSGVDVAGMVDVMEATPEPTDAATPEPAATPDAATTAPPAVDIRIYVDYLSTGSKQFQRGNVAQLSQWVTEDAATVTYYPVALLTAKSNGTRYSLRAASASACVATMSSDSFFAFNNALLAQQPAEDSPGMTNEELADLAQATGAEEPRQVRRCIESESYTSWARDATDRALAGIPDTDDLTLTGTPLVLVNGTPYVGALDDPREFSQFVLTIASDTYYRTASPTPTPTPASTP